MAALTSGRLALGAAARALRGAGDGLIAFSFPQRCPGCGAAADPARLLCERCFAAIPPLSMPLCARCLVRGREPVGCRAHPAFETWAARVYDERAACLIHAFKYDGRPALARVLADAVSAALPASAAPDLVVPVPLHPARRRERGFDPALRLAREVAACIATPLLSDALVRVRSTPPQVGLPESARRRNLRGAIVATDPARLAGRRVLVVDDVFTTGATLEACLAVLARAGALPAAAAFAWAQ